MGVRLVGVPPSPRARVGGLPGAAAGTQLGDLGGAPPASRCWGRGTGWGRTEPRLRGGTRGLRHRGHPKIRGVSPRLPAHPWPLLVGSWWPQEGDLSPLASPAGHRLCAAPLDPNPCPVPSPVSFPDPPRDTPCSAATPRALQRGSTRGDTTPWQQPQGPRIAPCLSFPSLQTGGTAGTAPGCAQGHMALAPKAGKGHPAPITGLTPTAQPPPSTPHPSLPPPR